MSTLLKDISDFIEPSQACIKPIDTKKSFQDSEQVKITLNDCLACSGCVTSAETMLVSSQSVEEVLKALELGKFTVFTISSQSVASIAAKYGLSLLSVWKRLSGFLKSKGVSRVYSIAFGNALFRTESALELEERLISGPLPVLCSSCPGWICYAEKRHSFLLDHISLIKSPQQIMGSLLKRVLSPQFHWIEPYHVSIMPCYDKKLEASRKDFQLDGIRDVDCVLTTSELETMWVQMGLDFCNLPENELDMELGDFSQANTYSAGGILEYLLESFLKTGYSLSKTESKDQTEYTLIKQNFRTIRLASLYGFKNIQNFIRKMKKNQCNFDYVEVMACPGACLAGAGQLKSSENGNPAKVQIEFSKRSLQSASPLLETDFAESQWALRLHQERLLTTEYHAVETNNFNLATQW